MKPKSEFSEKALASQETRIPQKALKAFSLAHSKALAVSGKVLQVSGGRLVELSAEGSVRVIKSIEPSFRVQAGVKRVRKVTRA